MVPFALTENERLTIARVVFAQVDVLQESLPKGVHATSATVKATTDTAADKLTEVLCKAICSAGQSPRRLPTKVKADLHAALYEGTRATTLNKHANEIIELLTDEIAKGQKGGEHGL